MTEENTQSRNLVILVDEHDNELGTEDKLVAHQKGLLHRAFSVMLYRYNKNNLELLLQQRNPEKYHCGGLWSNTCCSHPQPGDNTVDSALARLKEELGDIDTSLVKLAHVGEFVYYAEFNNGLAEHEYDHVFVAEYNKTPQYLNNDEVHEIKWVAVDELIQDYMINKANYTPWFYQVLMKVIASFT